MKIDEDNWLELVIENLELLKSGFEDDIIPTMVFDGDQDDKLDELQKLIDYLQKTN